MTEKLIDFFEEVPCNFCGSNEYYIVYPFLTNRAPKSIEELKTRYTSSGDDFIYEQVVRCKHCNLVFINPRPKSHYVVGGYSQAIDNRYVSQGRCRWYSFNKYINIIEKYIKRRGKALDIGAAAGFFVKAMKDRGWDVIGVEPSRWMCRWAEENLKVKIIPGEIENSGLEKYSFDLVTLWDVIEHVPDPMKTLQSAVNLLRPDGILVLSYPNIDDILAKITGRKWWFLLSIHLFYFNYKTISAYCQRVGLKIIKHTPYFQHLEYSYLVERLSNYSKLLSSIFNIPCSISKIKHLNIPYFASQYMIIAHK
jgi:2-polyprenyl-3-methyl-5-hydroxy-6-metoxy-1,4-benzoquinol methylase